MTAMGASHCGDMLRMPGCREPVMNRGPDATALDGWFAGPMMARNQQKNAVAACYCLLERMVDRGPCTIEVHAMKIEHPVRLDRSAPQLLVPAAVQRLESDRHRLRSSGFGRGRGTLREL
jgi:hypothetical protein